MTPPPHAFAGGAPLPRQHGALARRVHGRRPPALPVRRRARATAWACVSPRERGGRGRGGSGGIPRLGELPRLGRRGSIGVLHGVAVAWGTQHAVMKAAVGAGASPAALTLGRFGVAAVLLAPFLAGVTGAEVAAGLELGAWSFVGFALQTAGLATTTAARSGFLLYLNVKLVPLLGLLLGRRPPRSAWAAAAVAAAGTAALAADGAPWAPGDSLSVAAAAASAAFILRLEARARGARPAALSAVTVAVTAALAAGWTAATAAAGGGAGLAGAGGAGGWMAGGSVAAGAALYLGAVPTAAATVLQAWAQKEVSAERAAVVYALDPVYGAFFAYLLLGESFGVRGFVGAGLIFAAAFISNYAVGDSPGDSGGSADVQIGKKENVLDSGGDANFVASRVPNTVDGGVKASRPLEAPVHRAIEDNGSD